MPMNVEMTDAQAVLQLKKDEAEVNDFISGKSNSLDAYALKRLVLSELAIKNTFTEHRVFGFSRKQIINMAQYPERYGKQILKLMDFMYQKSGYMKRIIDYFSNMAELHYYIDTDVTSQQFFRVKDTTLKNNYIKFAAECEKLNLQNNVNEIIKQMFLHDACFAYVVESEIDTSYFFLDPKYCTITKCVNGNVFQFAVNRSLLIGSAYEALPADLQLLIEQSKEVSKNNLVEIPYENGLCIKYNRHFFHLFPPLFNMVADILLIDDYKDLAKTKAVNDAYKMVVLKIPTDKAGKLTMNEEQIKPYIETALNVVQDNIGVLPYPDDVQSVEFTSSNSDDRDKVADATTQMYKEQGVSEALMSGASSGSELKMSITNDSGDIYRIYRMLEDWVSLRMKLLGYLYPSYQFVYKIMNITTFNRDDVVTQELSLAQASIPNKARLCSAVGMSPSSMFGNTIMEEKIFKDVFNMWMPLKTSYTQSSDSSEDTGRPEMDDGELSESGETTRENGTNDPDNRV